MKFQLCLSAPEKNQESWALSRCCDWLSAQSRSDRKRSAAVSKTSRSNVNISTVQEGLRRPSYNPIRKLFWRSAIFHACIFSLHAANWPQFRGPAGLSTAEGSPPPVHFGPNSNVVWKAPLPSGNSSPVIWEEKIFLTAFDKSKLETLCVNARDGKILWRSPAPASKFEPTHKLGNPATPTAATDGQRVYVSFGSFGLLAYDFEGKEVWRHALPAPVVEFGTSASPILWDDLIILVCDQDENSFLLAVDKNTGKQKWRVSRAEFRRSFATPFVWQHGKEEELIVPGSIWLTSYTKDGSERWRYAGTSRVACSTPTASEDMLFSASWNIGGDEGARIEMEPFEEFARANDKNSDQKLARDEIPAGPVKDRFTQMDLNKDGIVTPAEWQNMRDMFAKAENAVLAIRPGGTGTINRTHLAWKSTRNLPYVSSPLYHNGRLYTIKSGGLFSCYDAKTGKAFYESERLDAVGDYYSSAVVCADRIYLTSQNGKCIVLAAGDEFKVLARNDLGEQVMATPAIIDRKLYLRTATALYCFGE
jgi:outer membrane protein assembly factor BamB